MNIKHCYGCNEDKPITEFSKSRTKKDGLQPKCKACNKIDNDKYRKEKPEYWSYEGDGYFADKSKWEYMKLYSAADKTIKIYMISFDDGSKYVGSTKAHLNVRLHRHVADYRRFLEGKKDRTIPLLHKIFNEFDSVEDIVEHIKENTVIIDECMGSKTKHYRLEAIWIKRLLKQGETLLNKTIPHRYQNVKV